MRNDDSVPELQRILGSLIVAAASPISARQLREVLKRVAESGGQAERSFGLVTESQIRAALDELKMKMDSINSGFSIVEVAGGYRLQTDASCASWVRDFLQAERGTGLSRPALETLAIIAYRQPVTRSEIEAVRGVNVDHVMGTLLEMQLVRIVGRSELPGRPFLYGTTNIFLEHFGLKDLESLPNVKELSRSAENARQATVPAGDQAVHGVAHEPAAEGQSAIQKPESN